MFEVPELGSAPRIQNRIGLLDSDCIAYWAAAGCDDMPFLAVEKKVEDRISMICDQIQTDEIRHFLTGPDNFREKVARYQRYKGNRYAADGTRIKPQPKWLSRCRDYLRVHHKATTCLGQEADDALAIAQTKCNASRGWHSIISSIDKDLKIIPGYHHDMNSGYIDFVEDPGKLEILPNGKMVGQGLKFFYAQLLMGDAADWIPGLPSVIQEIKDEFGPLRLGGCGPKTAYKILDGADTEPEMLARVSRCYELYWNGDRWFKDWRTDEQVYPTPEEALTEQGQLLWMRRKEGEMWQIPNL